MLIPLCDDLIRLAPFYTCCDIRVKNNISEPAAEEQKGHRLLTNGLTLYAKMLIIMVENTTGYFT